MKKFNLVCSKPGCLVLSILYPFDDGNAMAKINTPIYNLKTKQNMIRLEIVGVCLVANYLINYYKMCVPYYLNQNQLYQLHTIYKNKIISS